MSELYDVFALKYGAHSAGRTRRDSFMLATDDHAVPHPIDYFVWVIKNDKRTILVDTGFEEKEAALRGRKINAQLASGNKTPSKLAVSPINVSAEMDNP